MKSTSSASSMITKRQVMDRIIKKARDLRMLPEVASKAIAAADDPDTSIQSLANIIAQDPHLTISILRISNSPMYPSYASARNVSCLKMAVTRLGFRQVKQIMLVASYSRMLDEMDFQDVQLREKLNRHGFLTGIVSSKLNQLFHIGLQGEEFTAGLLHDIGHLLLAISDPDLFQSVLQSGANESQNQIEIENEKLGINHAEIGAWFLNRNQMTEELIHVAKYHHDPYQSIRFTRLVALVSAADELARYFDQHGSMKGFDGSELPSLVLLESLGIQDAKALLMEHQDDLMVEANANYEQFTSS